MAHVEIIDAANAHLSGDRLEQVYRARHRALVERGGWSDLARPDGRDVDRFDDGAATYLVAFDGERIVGGQRLYPTLRPHLMTEVFAPLLTREPPVGPDVLEATRHFVVCARRQPATDFLLAAAAMEFCLRRGVAAVTAMVETWWLPRWLEAGVRTRPLGLPVEIQGRTCLPLEIAVAADVCERLRRLAGVTGPALRETRPAADDARRPSLH